MTNPPLTLTQFIIEEQRRNAPKATGDLSGLLVDIATACKMIAREVRQGALTAAQEATEQAQNARRGRLAEAARDILLRACGWAGHIAGAACGGALYPVVAPHPLGKYLLVLQPLEGGGDIDINVPAGTLFSVLRSPRPGKPASAEDFLQDGASQVAAGFALYGPSTLLVMTSGHGVNAYTLEQGIGEFVLSHPRMKIPAESGECSLNPCNERHWEPPVRRYIEDCLAGRGGPLGREVAMRGAASLSADAFRILLRGGIFLHPRDASDENSRRQARLLAEAWPIAFLAEQAGGAASTGRRRLMSMEAKSLSERSPLIFGTKAEVERIVRYHQEYAAGKEPDLRPSPLFGSRSLFRQ